MRTASLFLALAAAANIAVQTPLAHAQTAVQPVPYNPSQPVGAAPAPFQPLPSQPVAPPGVAVTGGDVVILKGGGMLRGRLVEVIPNDHATIALSTGQNAIIEWSRIERIEQAPAGYAPGQAPAAPPLPPPPAGRVWVHIESDRELLVEGLGHESGWQHMCSSPCDMELPLDLEYRLLGDGVRPSQPFRLQALAGQHEVIDVTAASKGGYVGGVTLVGIGSVLIGLGLIVLAFGALQNSVGGTCPDGISTGCGSPGNGTEAVGGIMALVGAAGLVGGIVLTVNNSRTSAKQSIAQPGPRARLGDDGAWVRLPMWHDASAQRSLPTPQLSPIFSRSF